MSERTPVVEKKKGLADDIVESIMTPGYTAKGVIKIMFYAFYALFATLFAMIFLTGGNLHVVVLLLLAFCLFVLIKWFLISMEEMKIEQQQNTTKKQN